MFSHTANRQPAAPKVRCGAGSKPRQAAFVALTALAAMNAAAPNTAALAKVQVQAYYRGGEADPPNSKPGEDSATTTRDSSGHDRDMIHCLGALHYTSEVSKAAAAAGSTRALRISESGTCYSDDVKGFGLGGKTTGWGLEGWFQSRTANEAHTDGSPAEKWLFGMGSPFAKNGMAIAQLGNQFVGILNGVTYVEADPPLKVQPGQWVHLALVADSDGNAKLYVNGDVRATRNAQPGALLDKDGALIGVRPGGDAKVKDAAVDELRIFTFDGQFDPRDLLVNQPPASPTPPAR